MEAEVIITAEELATQDLDEQVQVNRSLEDMARASRSIIHTPPQRNPAIYYPMGAAVGTAMGWGLVQILLHYVPLPQVRIWPAALLYILSGGLGAIWIGLLYGLIHGNPIRALKCAFIGGLIGALAPLATGGMAEGLTWLLVDLPVRLTRSADGIGGLSPTKGMGLFLDIAAHGFGWGLIGLTMVLGPGLAMKSPRLTHNGAVGGLIGGALGGALIPVWFLVLPDSQVVAEISGIATVGLLVGLGFGVMHFATRDSWFVLAKGTLYGKRLLFYKEEMTIGISHQADIVLHDDPNIAPIHARLQRTGLRWLITNLDAEAGTFVNGHKVERCLLNPNDVVTIGESVLKFKQRSIMD